MKTPWVATHNAGKTIGDFIIEMNWRKLFLIALIGVYSCSNDDLEAIENDSSIEKEPPVSETPPVAEVPHVDEPPVQEEPPVYEESVIIYTDIEPDFAALNSKVSYDLDLNNDNIVDYTIGWKLERSFNWEYLVIKSNSSLSNKVLSVTPWYAYPLPLPKEKLIYNGYYSQGETFEYWGTFSIGECFGGDATCSYDWLNKGERYLGLRFEIAGKQHFAWVRMQIMSTTNWMIMDYAYNAIPNKEIYAGQK